MEYIDILYNCLVSSNGDYDKFRAELNDYNICYTGFPDLLILKIVKEGHINSLIMMIEKYGLDPNATLYLLDEQDINHTKSLLNYALEFRQQQIAEMLILEKNVTVSISSPSLNSFRLDNFQSSPISLAVTSGFLNVVHMIYGLTKDVDSSYYNNLNFRSQLTLNAIKSNNYEIINYLALLNLIDFKDFNIENYYCSDQKESWYIKYSTEVLQPLEDYVEPALNAQTHFSSKNSIQDKIKVTKKYSQLIKVLKSDRHNLNDSKTYDIVNQLKELQNLLVNEILDNSSSTEIAEYFFSKSSQFALGKEALFWLHQIHSSFENEVIGNIAKFVIYSELCE